MLTLLKLYRAVVYYVGCPHMQSLGSKEALRSRRGELGPKRGFAAAEIKQADRHEKSGY